jgi:glycosyl transferase family 2
MQHSDTQLYLSVIIPVWNDHAGLAQILRQLLPMPGVDQIIVVDDASEPPCSPKTIDLPKIAEDSRVIWLRNDIQRGAGHARNIGLEQVSCPYVLFFDSDDLFLPGISYLLTELAAPNHPPFDFCLFRHVDSRTMTTDNPAPLAGDQRHWDAIAVPEAPTFLSPTQAVRICSIAAYPWNKIYRTAFLREQNIRCTEIMVHNDVELHWLSFLRARNILASSRLCCKHFVHEDGRRLTNHSGAQRLKVFSALEAVQAEITADAYQTATYANAAAEFYLNLFRWIDRLLEPDLRPTFHRKAQIFFRQALSLPVFTLIATSDPDLARDLNQFLMRPIACD